jgi:hypothetical protein
MKVAVWDTYVTRPDGAVTHFDIIVPEEVKDQNIVFDYGKSYLATTGKPEGSLSGQECQLCHIEEPTPEMITQIEAQGYYILEMDDIPGTLPENPSKRDLILHLRAHYARFRFADFAGKSIDDIQGLFDQTVRD